jgi:hypothetical protein
VGKNKPEPIFTLEIPVYDVSDKIFMTIGGGSADYQGEPMTVSSTLRGDVVLGFREKQYILKVDDVGFALYERLNEDGKPE